MTAGELAKFLGVKKETVSYWIRSGKIEPDGGQIEKKWHLFAPETVSRILDQRLAEIKRREHNAERKRKREAQVDDNQEGRED